ncbi:serine/threonine-protein kinase [Nocardia pseudovaccinii]|uniref:serine/threonine-protein kinase n=1 Tax=Nocardia pseudovaccinii TaxID=189540 RepID=UPI000A95A7A1|nr:serine/threonine-protein kinase [Nocardia pseudovaccinii]
MDGPGWRVGTRFGPYELRALLGKGGMGEVYEAYDTVKDRVVAVKLLSDELARDPVYQVRFRRESQAAARLAEPHIIPIHDWGVIDGVLFIDMRLVPGTDLRKILRNQGPMSAERAIGIIEQIAAGLDAAHADGLVHRDVKPANILVTEADFAYLVDFGIAHIEGDSAVTQAGMAIGSYTYMAPERFDSGPVTGRADIYSLACVLHECLTGATPFPSGSMSGLIRSHLTEAPPRPSVQRPGVPAAMDEVIARGMAKEAADRFPTATDLARAARAALGTAPAANTPTLIVRPPDPSRGPSDQAVVHRGPASPAESTGTIPAVIHPTGPTVVSPADLQFTPLPPQPPAGPPFGSPGVGRQVRPFPDAHLYEESPPEFPQHLPSPRYPGDPAAPPTQRYPESHYPEAGYPEARYPARQYPEQYGAQQNSSAPETRRVPLPEPFSGTPPFEPPRGPAHAAPNPYRPSPRPAEYSPQGYAEPDYENDYYAEDPAADPDQRDRSVMLPIMVTVFVIVVLAVGGAIGWQVLGSGKSGDSNVQAGARVTTTAAIGTAGGSTTSPSTSTTKAAPTSVTLPAGATNCTNGQPVAGSFTQSATGSSVTSCGFAEAVRKAYAESAATNVSRSSRSVVAASPVTGRTYTMNCVAEGQLVTCTGGENAVVYIY